MRVAQFDDWKTEGVFVFGGNKVSFFHSDHLGTPRVRTNLSGGVEETWDSYPFGEAWGATATPDQHRYTGHLRDSESENDYAGARYYASLHARWLSVDPARGTATNPQSLNRYSYVMNDPVNYIDPDGELRVPSNPSAWFEERWLRSLFEQGRERDPFSSGGGAARGGTANLTLIQQLVDFLSLAYQQQLIEYLDGLGPGCTEFFGGAEGVAALKDNARKLLFYDATIQVIGNLPLRWFGFDSDVSLRDYVEAQGDTWAVILPSTDGSRIRNIVLLHERFVLGLKDVQNIVLFHELLHFHFQEDDRALAGRFGVFVGGQDVDFYSRAVSEFLARDCPN